MKNKLRRMDSQHFGSASHRNKDSIFIMIGISIAITFQDVNVLLKLLLRLCFCCWGARRTRILEAHVNPLSWKKRLHGKCGACDWWTWLLTAAFLLFYFNETLTLTQIVNAFHENSHENNFICKTLHLQYHI